MRRPPALRVRRDTAELGRVRRRVAEWAGAAGLNETRARRLALAVDETVANAIEHGMAPESRVGVSAEIGHRRLVVTVRYRGPHFDPLTAETPGPADALRQRAAHGYGLHLIRSLVDEAAYRWDAGTNEVWLVARE